MLLVIPPLTPSLPQLLDSGLIKTLKSYIEILMHWDGMRLDLLWVWCRHRSKD